MTEALWLLGTAWLIGAGVTAAKLSDVSTDSPVARFLISLFLWPLFWILK
jgi:hypothetical protein